MTFVDLEYILAIADSGNLTRAAQKLYISQPALSQRLQKVENELGASLFIRSANGLEPTQNGLMFVDMARRVLGIYDEFNRHLATASDTAASALRIGIPPNQSRTLAPLLGEAFSDRYPKITLAFKNGNSDWLEEGILSGEIDLGIIHNPFVNSRLDYQTLEKVPIRIYLRKNSPVAARGRHRAGFDFPVLSLQDIRDEPIGVSLPGMRTRMIIDHCFRKENVTPNIVQEMSAFESLRGLSDSGICTILYPWVTTSEPLQDEGRVFDIDSPNSYCLEIVLAHRADRPHLKTYDAVYQILREHYRFKD